MKLDYDAVEDIILVVLLGLGVFSFALFLVGLALFCLGLREVLCGA